MGKAKYTEEIKNKAIELRLSGKSSTEITEEIGMGIESQNKLFKKMGIKLTEEQAVAARARRWLNHQPVVNGKKVCSKCGDDLPIEDFHKNKNRLSGVVSSCKKCYGVYYEENSEYIIARVQDYKDRNPEKRKETNQNYYKENKEYHINKSAEWNKNNPEKARESARRYGKKNQPKKNARTAHYRAAKIEATPPWLTQHQLDEMKRMYENCPKGFDVDHIVPLRGKNVRGLHVPWNLQYLPALENNKKGNRI
jgi:Zn-finger protein